MEPFEEVEEINETIAIGRPDRRAPRISRRITLQVALKSRGQDLVCSVNTVNFSKTGLRVKAHRLTWEPGQPVIALPNKSSVPTGYCRVVWVNEGEAGLEFIN